MSEKIQLSPNDRKALQSGALGDLTEDELLAKKGAWKKVVGIFEGSEILDEVDEIVEKGE